jgi:hypothetical protein
MALLGLMTTVSSAVACLNSSPAVSHILIEGQVYGTVGGVDQFGVVAERIVACKLDGIALPMTSGMDVLNIGPTFDLTVRDAPQESRFRPGFPAEVELAELHGNRGFSLSGAGAGDFAGGSVSDAGDVNGDGFGDLIIGAPFAHPNGAESGAAYVVFGKAAGFFGKSSALNTRRTQWLQTQRWRYR